MLPLPLLLTGVVVGALSHVLWDSASHSYGSLVSKSIFWNTEFFSLPAYKWNQYGSGVIGLGILGLWYLFELIKNLKSPYSGNFWLGLTVYGVSTTSLVLAANVIHQTSSIPEFAVQTSIGVMSGVTVGAFAYAAILKIQITH